MDQFLLDEVLGVSLSWCSDRYGHSFEVRRIRGLRDRLAQPTPRAETVARIVPSDIARLELAGANRHEIETLRLLQARLPDSYTVFHGVHWTREWPSETVFGELDFVVVNRAGKALLIEQKDGTLEETEDGLIAHYADRSKSVVDQVQRAGQRPR